MGIFLYGMMFFLVNSQLFSQCLFHLGNQVVV